MMYVLLAKALNNGAIGLMRDLLWVWVLMFHACGKHKYVTHVSKFLQDLQDTYPARLSHTIEMHWLCNPTGTPDGFRGMDWWVELNKLYTKVSQHECHTNQLTYHIRQIIFCEKRSNRTLTHIINQYSLIDTYRSSHI